MKDSIFIHDDIDSLKYFKDINGISPLPDRVVGYAMQGANIVKIFYSSKMAIDFYNQNRYTENIPVLYRFDDMLLQR